MTAVPSKLILLSVSTALGSVLRGQLQALDQVTVSAQIDPTAYDGPRPDLIVFEVTAETDNLAHRLLSTNVSNRLIFIGPVSATLSRQRGLRAVDMRELSADVSVAEVVRVCREMLTGLSIPASSFSPLGSSSLSSSSQGRNDLSLSSEPPLPSLASNPYELEVFSQQPNASLPALPAPLFPVSLSPSSNPSRRPSSGAPAPGPLSDTGDDPQFDLEPGLKALLDDAERRIASELSPRLTSPPEPLEDPSSEEPFLMSAEVRAVLAEPVGRYGTLGRAIPHSGSPYSDFATRTGHGNTAHNPASPSSTGTHSSTGTRSSTSALSSTNVSSSTGNRVPQPSPALGSEPVRQTPELESNTRSTDHLGNEIGGEPAPWTEDAALSSEGSVGQQSITTKPPAPPVSRQALLSPAVPPAPLLPKEHDPRPRTRHKTADADQSRARHRPPSSPDAHADDALRGVFERNAGTGSTPEKGDEHSGTRHETPVADALPRAINRDVMPTHRPGPRDAARTLGRGQAVGATTPSNKQESDTPSEEPLLASPSLEGAPLVRHTRITDPVKAVVPDRSSKRVSDLPPLGSGDSMALIARTIRTRYTGAIVFENDGGVRRIVMRDGDFVTAASGIQSESLLAYLVAQGTLSRAIAHRLEHRLPHFGRHAGAALIAAGHLTQEQLWPCLRAHAEHVITNILKLTGGVANFEEQVPERLANEPAVFGGATGAEVLIELVRRVIAPTEAVRLLGGPSARLSLGTAASLLDECALSKDELEALPRIYDRPLGEGLASTRLPALASVLYALCQLKVLQCEADRVVPEAADSALDEQALRELIANRRALVEEADYFELLGVPPTATAYDIGRAYLSLKRTFQPATLLTAGVTDLDEDVRLIATVIEEAYDILRDNTRRERYRKALQSLPS